MTVDLKEGIERGDDMDLIPEDAAFLLQRINLKPDDKDQVRNRISRFLAQDLTGKTDITDDALTALIIQDYFPGLVDPADQIRLTGLMIRGNESRVVDSYLFNVGLMRDEVEKHLREPSEGDFYWIPGRLDSPLANKLSSLKAQEEVRRVPSLPGGMRSGMVVESFMTPTSPGRSGMNGIWISKAGNRYSPGTIK